MVLESLFYRSNSGDGDYSVGGNMMVVMVLEMWKMVVVGG